MSRVFILLVLLSSMATGPGRGEFLTEFNPNDMPGYWVGLWYRAEAVRFDVGEDSASIDEVWLHYDVYDSIGLYITHTVPDTNPSYLLHGGLGIRIPPESAGEWMPIDLRGSKIRASGKIWIVVQNRELFAPPGISLRGIDAEPVTSYALVWGEEDWLPVGGNIGVGILINEPTGIEEPDEAEPLPPMVSLSQNYPNPFNPRTIMVFSVPGSPGTRQRVSLAVYDIRGRLVRRLIDSEREPGSHSVVWSGEDDLGRQVPSGLYFYTLRVGEESFTKKMILEK